MKKILFLFAMAALFVACGNRDAMGVARAFLQAYYIDHDFDRARALSTPATHELFREWVTIFELTPREMNPHIFRQFEIDDVEVLTTRATVRYRVDNIHRQLLLREVDGRWMVDMPPGVLSTNRSLFSLSLNRPETGGFTSAESRPTRIGGVPEE